MNKPSGLLAAMLFACATIASAQTTTKTVETTAANSEAFTSSGTAFDIVSHNAIDFDIEHAALDAMTLSGRFKSEVQRV